MKENKNDMAMAVASGPFFGNTQKSRSSELLNKVYDHLDSIDVSKLSLREMTDFLEVVQKGRFLESTGQMPGYGLTSFCAAPFNGPRKTGEDKKE